MRRSVESPAKKMTSLFSQCDEEKNVPKKILVTQKISASIGNFLRIDVFQKFIFFSDNLKMWLKDIWLKEKGLAGHVCSKFHTFPGVLAAVWVGDER